MVSGREYIAAANVAGKLLDESETASESASCRLSGGGTKPNSVMIPTSENPNLLFRDLIDEPMFLIYSP